MEKFRIWLERILPKYARIPLIITLALNCSVYWGARQIAGNWQHHNMETKWDQMIPLVPAMLIIYLSCYVYWTIYYILGSSENKTQCYRFLMADWLGKLVCFIIYVVYPTTNVRPEIVGEGILAQGMRFLYSIDKADNLFPSIHCFVSWICYLGVRGNKRYPLWVRVVGCFFAIAVFASTLMTKQHVIYDVVAGVLLAEITYFITGKIFKNRILEEK